MSKMQKQTTLLMSKTEAAVCKNVCKIKLDCFCQQPDFERESTSKCPLTAFCSERLVSSCSQTWHQLAGSCWLITARWCQTHTDTLQGSVWTGLSVLDQRLNRKLAPNTHVLLF